MAFEQYIAKEWKSLPLLPQTVAESEEAPTPPCFDCNICLDFANDPVVTLCGHLYCWPCIYKWFHIQSASLASDEPPQCPACKAAISHTTVVPLYGRGKTPPKPEPQGKAPYLGMIIPPRPPACGTDTLITTSNTGHQQLPYRNPYQNYQNPQYEEEESIEENTAMGGFNPVVGMYGEMVYARVFGNSESLYAYPNSYHLVGSSNSSRFRRQEMQTDKSLNRISIFFFFCFLLCLLLF